MEIRRGKWNRMNRGGEQRDQREGDNYTEQRDMDKGTKVSPTSIGPFQPFKLGVKRLMRVSIRCIFSQHF